MKRVIVTIVSCMMMVSACSEKSSKLVSLPDITTESKEGRSFSSAEIRQMFVDQPWLASGDYFLKRDPQKESIFLVELFADAGERAKTEATQQEKRIARLEEAVFKKETTPITPIQRPQYRKKIGFLIDYQHVNLKDGEAFLKIAREVTTTKGAIYVDHHKIKEVLSKTDCLEKRDLACVSRVSGIYPGVRFLNVVELLSIPTSTKQQNAKARVSIVDTGLSYRHPSLEVEMPIKAEADRQEFMKLIAEKLVEVSFENQNIMPWFCHAFSQESHNRWFISAGSASGLKEGDVLKIIPGGKVVNSPTGTPAAWLPAESKGTVKVERIVNEELAIVSLASGSAPTLEDYLIP
ncbi:MAG: hypothetical protein N2260_10620 [Syntrophobacterales bacterium]|nr:hypothetical protein [Syntrophobacterales bacterium]